MILCNRIVGIKLCLVIAVDGETDSCLHAPIVLIGQHAVRADGSLLFEVGAGIRVGRHFCLDLLAILREGVSASLAPPRRRLVLDILALLHLLRHAATLP